MGNRQGNKCHRCGSLMLKPNYDDGPMHCMVCGAQGDMPTCTKPLRSKHDITNFKGAHPATIYMARYRRGTTHTVDDRLAEKVVRYRLTSGPHGSTYPALAVECPWCAKLIVEHSWHVTRRRSRKGGALGYASAPVVEEYSMYIDCPTRHAFTMICDNGNYYWR